MFTKISYFERWLFRISNDQHYIAILLWHRADILFLLYFLQKKVVCTIGKVCQYWPLSEAGYLELVTADIVTGDGDVVMTIT